MFGQFYDLFMKPDLAGFQIDQELIGVGFFEFVGFVCWVFLTG